MRILLPLICVCACSNEPQRATRATTSEPLEMVGPDRRTPSGSIAARVRTDAAWCQRCVGAGLDCYQSGASSDPWVGCGNADATWTEFEGDAGWCRDCRARGGRCSRNDEPHERWVACIQGSGLAPPRH